MLDVSDFARDDLLREELQQSNGRPSPEYQREHLSATNEDGVQEVDDPEMAGQRSSQPIDEQTADYSDEHQK